MRILTLTLLACAAIGAPVTAQKMGGTNHNAPYVTQTFASHDSTIEVLVEYTAITWAGGQVMERILDQAKGERIRAHVNRTAPTNPLGSLRSDKPLKIGTQNIPAGLYSLFFTIDEKLAWHLHAQDERDDDVHFKWKLNLESVKREHSRLRIGLVPGKTDYDCKMAISFGKMRGTLKIERGSAKPAKKDAKKTASRPQHRAKSRPTSRRSQPKQGARSRRTR